MKQTKLLMGMPITIEILDNDVTKEATEKIFSYFMYIDNKFSPFKKTSETFFINEGKINEKQYSKDMKTVITLSEETKRLTDGYFDVYYNGKFEPSGLVKGWSIVNAASLLNEMKFHNYYIEAGGDIQVSGKNKQRKPWKIGIRNPFNEKEIVKIVYLQDQGVATSGSYIRGNHICDPKSNNGLTSDIVSVTIIGPNVYEADRYATSVYAMGGKGIHFIESLKEFAGYVINNNGVATFTSNFNTYTSEPS